MFSKELLLEKSELRFLFFTDCHLSGDTPSGRKDNFPKTILNKLREVYKIAKDKSCDFVLFGGDFFNSHRIFNYDILLEAIEILRSSELQTYFIIGQHDLYGYNEKTYKTSTLKFIEGLSEGVFIPIEDKLELGFCTIHASHCWEDVLLKKIDKNDKYNVLMAHALLHSKDMNYSIIRTDTLKDNEYDLVLSGDLHNGYAYHKIENTSFYNPGALARVKNNESDRTRNVQVGIFEIKKSDSNYDIVFEEVKIQAQSPEDIFAENEVEQAIVLTKSDELEDFVKEVNSFEVDAIDIFDLIAKVGKMSGQKNELLDYLLKFKEKQE